MSAITTYSGKLFDPTNPTIEGIDIIDITHALSLLCRGNGHVKHFYSVGQHSISCYKEAKKRNYSKKIQLACLLHDASEAYLSDITRPVKPKLPEYLAMEDKLQNMIWQKFLEEPLSEEELKQVFSIDDDILSYEFEYLMPKKISDNYKNLITKPDLSFVDPFTVEKEFMDIVERELKTK
ncbi:HD domain-containing protein [Terrisporobacter sp.]